MINNKRVEGRDCWFDIDIVCTREMVEIFEYQFLILIINILINYDNSTNKQVIEKRLYILIKISPYFSHFVEKMINLQGVKYFFFRKLFSEFLKEEFYVEKNFWTE